MDAKVGRSVPPDLARLVARVRGEFDEMPGMWLTAPQFCRLFGINAPTCRKVVAALLADRFLQVKRGAYGRVSAQR